MILFDTDTWTHFGHANANVRRKLQEAGDEVVAITIITRLEVIRGRSESLLKAADEEQLRKAVTRFQVSESLLARFRVVGFDETSISNFGTLKNHSKLKKIGRADLLIACIALANAALLVTRNVKDYRNIPDLRIENWVD